MALDLTHETQAWLGLQERELSPWFRRLSSRIATGIDVGAGRGELVLFFLLRTAAKLVLAFEPDDTVRSRIEDNLRLNGIDLGERLLLSPRFVGMRSDEESTTLDSYLHLIDGPCVVKIDVDGQESDVLAGASQLLRRTDVSWIVEVHSKDLEEQCLAVLRSVGLETEVLRQAWWRIIAPELRPIELNRWIVAYRMATAAGW
jgi:hypothetical protein